MLPHPSRTMQSDYHIQALVFQDGDRVVYRARNKEGEAFAIIRLKLPSEVLPRLTESSFDLAYKQLTELKHPNLRTVVDGGLDPVDRYPWVAVPWFNGTPLGDQTKFSPVETDTLELVKTRCRDLFEFLGDRSGALSLDPADIIHAGSADSSPQVSFIINFWIWFLDHVEKNTPGAGQEPEAQLKSLIEGLQFKEEVPPPVIQRPKSLPPQPKPGQVEKFAPPKPPSRSGPIITILLLLALLASGVWWVIQRRAYIISEEEREAAERAARKNTASKQIAPSR